MRQSTSEEKENSTSLASLDYDERGPPVGPWMEKMRRLSFHMPVVRGNLNILQLFRRLTMINLSCEPHAILIPSSTKRMTG